MSVANPSVVDAIGVDPSSGEVVLTIFDPLDWVDGESHLTVLQDKLNAYLAFIESGEILEAYPNAVGREVVIELVINHSLSSSGVDFFSHARDVIQNAGFDLRLKRGALDLN